MNKNLVDPNLRAVLMLPLPERIERLRHIEPEAADALEVIVNHAIVERWAAKFYRPRNAELKIKATLASLPERR
jgi:hypothetical protein